MSATPDPAQSGCTCPPAAEGHLGWCRSPECPIHGDGRSRSYDLGLSIFSPFTPSDAAVARVPDLSIHEHVALAERHAQRALDLAYKDEPQSFRVRWTIGKAQSALISLIANGRLR